MAQAGMHALVGMIIRKNTGKREWLLLGVLLGSLIPDMDNLAVALATLAKASTEGLHRTLTHSLLFIAAVVLLFWLVGRFTRQARWGNLGLGLGLGIFMHILLDLLIWFNGVALFWPFPIWINLWAQITPPAWFMKLMDPLEFLFFSLYLWALGIWSGRLVKNVDFTKTRRAWLMLEIALFVIFTPLAFIMTKGFQTIYGAFYLLSLLMTFFLTIRMRQTIEAAAA